MPPDRAESLVTIALPTYNGARHLAEALRGALAQGEGFPLLLCDDRSSDDTLDVAREIAGDRVRIEVNPERLGLAGNWNRCIGRAETPLVAILHQDDVWRPEHLAAHVASWTANPEVGLIASASSVIDAQGREVPAPMVERGGLGNRDRTFGPGEAVRAMAVSNLLRCSAVTITREAHRAVGGFDPSYRYAVDWEFWLRVARRFGVSWIARTTVDVRWHIESETHRFARGFADLEETSRLHDLILAQDAAGWPDAATLHREAIRRLARAYLNRAYQGLHAGDAALSRTALGRALRLDRSGVLRRIAADPRLAVQMAALGLVPRWAARVFTRIFHPPCGR